MSRGGNVLVHPNTGERLELRGVEKEEVGRELVATLRIAHGGSSLPAHSHPMCEKRVTVKRGRVLYRLDGTEGSLGEGEELIVPAGAEHDLRNGGDSDAEVELVVRPGARLELWMLTLYGLAYDGLTDDRGVPNLLQAAITSREFDDVIRIAHPLGWMRRMFNRVLAPVAQALGYLAYYEEYSAERLAERSPRIAEMRGHGTQSRTLTYRDGAPRILENVIAGGAPL